MIVFGGAHSLLNILSRAVPMMIPSGTVMPDVKAES